MITFSRAIRLPRSMALFFALAGLWLPAMGQENAPGPLAPPPDHDVKRIIGVPQPEAPPSLPPAEIIKAFSEKEQLYVATRPQYSYRKTIRIQELGSDGRPTGEYVATYDAARAADGKLYEKGVSAFPITPSLLAKYNVQYLNTETVDEVQCYIFQVSPKTLDRQHPLFDGVIWVDQKYLEVVKTYGRWITDLGEMHPPSLPFTMFETYRENVDGKYWFPNYSRAEGVYKMKNRDVPIRVTIKWTDFKAFPPMPVVPTVSPEAPPQPAAPPPAPAPAAGKP